MAKGNIDARRDINILFMKKFSVILYQNIIIGFIAVEERVYSILV